MAAKIKTLKDKTFEAIVELKKKFPKIKELKKSDEYPDLLKSLNTVEKENINDILKMVYSGSSCDEVRDFINGKTNDKIDAVFNGETKMPEETEAEAFFMASQGKVVEVEPISVLVGESDDEVDKKETNIKSKEIKAGSVETDEVVSETTETETDGSEDEEPKEKPKMVITVEDIWDTNRLIIRGIIKRYLANKFKNTKITDAMIDGVFAEMNKLRKYDTKYKYSEITDSRKRLIESALDFSFTNEVVSPYYNAIIKQPTAVAV